MICIKPALLLFLSLITAGYSTAQNENRSGRLEKKALRRSGFIPEMFGEWKHTGGVKIDSIHVFPESREMNFYFNPLTSHIPVRNYWLSELKSKLEDELGHRLRKFEMNFWLSNRPLQDFIPNAFRDSLTTRDDMRYFSKPEEIPLVIRENQPHFNKGLTGNHIALWPSHGFFFDQQLDRWQWQRARLWQTVEDIFPWSFTSAYLIPMLENSGAYVLLPRERDTQVNEAIVDTDWSTESGGVFLKGNAWDSLPGFKWSDTIYATTNPFKEGTSLITSVVPGDTVSALYIPDIPESGYYGVYVSYPLSDDCINSVPYTVNHTGGSQRFFVNQCMAYGTWVYLGTFHFSEGVHPDSGSVLVSGSNLKGILGTDAVKFGGGMGNIARKPGSQLLPRQRSSGVGTLIPDTLPSDTVEYEWKISGKPRWMEGSRYYLQYAGMPDTITYSLNAGTNDYNDDYMSRPEWVNYLIGPARRQYTGKYQAGLNIPVDLSLAFHTDAGITENDSIIGTLGIYSTVRNEGIFPDGRTKMASRDLTDIIQTQLVDDIRRLMNPEWTRRGLWDREYSEAWRPVVPSMLLELLSHQNLADMKFGLDPRFKFVAARSVYKGILRYLSSAQQREVVVQPLPPDHMAIEVLEGKRIRISWQAVIDPLEPSAMPNRYFLYMKKEDNGFGTGLTVQDNFIILELEAWNTIYSFAVTAVNEGGESMPGETLSVSLLPGRQPVLIVNAFDRICAPAFFDKGDMAGIAWWEDEGVPHISDVSFSGYQYNFNRNSEWLHDDSQGWGASRADMETIPVAGNTFSYPLIHGKAIRNTGTSFISVSDEVFESPSFPLNSYRIVDLILGEERGTDSFKSDSGKDFRVFTPSMIRALRQFASDGGNILATGAYIGTDMMENSDSSAIYFAAETLHYIWRSNHATSKGAVITTDQGRHVLPDRFAFNTSFGPDIYRVESPDAIEPEGKGAFRICRYESGNTSAGVAYKGNYKTVIFGFPFETITNEIDRNKVMKGIMDFFSAP